MSFNDIVTNQRIHKRCIEVIEQLKKENKEYKQKVREAIEQTIMLEEELNNSTPSFRSRRKDMNYAIGEFKKKLIWKLDLKGD
jgi:uncharacterized protein YaaN involved in tellurite resistance